MAYSIKPGHGVALVTLVAFDPQPRCEGLEYTRRIPMPDGTVLDEGPFFRLMWDYFETAAAYQAVLTLSGLISAKSALVTVTGPDENYNESRFNATIIKPRTGQDISRRNFYIRGIMLLCRDLVEL